MMTFQLGWLKLRMLTKRYQTGCLAHCFQRNMVFLLIQQTHAVVITSLKRSVYMNASCQRDCSSFDPNFKRLMHLGLT